MKRMVNGFNPFIHRKELLIIKRCRNILKVDFSVSLSSERTRERFKTNVLAHAIMYNLLIIMLNVFETFSKSAH